MLSLGSQAEKVVSRHLLPEMAGTERRACSAAEPYGHRALRHLFCSRLSSAVYSHVCKVFMLALPDMSNSCISGDAASGLIPSLKALFDKVLGNLLI